MPSLKRSLEEYIWRHSSIADKTRTLQLIFIEMCKEITTDTSDKVTKTLLSKNCDSQQMITITLGIYL